MLASLRRYRTKLSQLKLPQPHPPTVTPFHMERRQKIDNRGDRLLMVFTEPEAQNYWLKPGDEFEVRAPITDENAQFEISIHEEGITVWPPNEMGYISVWKDNVELDCGHQRPWGWGM